MLKPVSELATGALRYFTGRDFPVSPSLVIYALSLLAGLVFLLLYARKSALPVGISLALALALSVGGELARGVAFSLQADLEYMLQFGYSLVLLLIIRAEGEDGNNARAKLERLFLWTVAVYALGIIVPYLLGIGYYTYDDPLGARGSRGLFYAGNDVSASLMLLLPVMLGKWLASKHPLTSWKWLAAAALAGGALMLLGTKTAFIGVAVTALVLLVYSVIRAIRGERTYIIRLGALAVSAVVVLLGANLALGGRLLRAVYDSLAATHAYTKLEDMVMVILSGRQIWLITSWNAFVRGLPATLLVGIGRGTQTTLVEMDPADIVFYYGIAGGALMLWPYVHAAKRAVSGILASARERIHGPVPLCCALALLLALGHLTIAGHILLSPMSGPVLAFILSYAGLGGSDVNGLREGEAR